MNKTQLRMMTRLVLRLIRRGRHNRMSLFWAVAVVALSLPWLWHELSGPAGNESISRNDRLSCSVRNIYDGDTMTVLCDGREEKVRLYCIDAPEMGQQPWGQQSRDHLRRITPGQVEVRAIERDRYGRLVGEVIAQGRSLNLAMVEAGQAVVYDRYCSDVRYTGAEKNAKMAQAGVWMSAGNHQEPWQFR